MSQESFIYSFVARGTMLLAEYTEFTGNFPAIAAQCLQKLPSSNNKFTYNCDHHTFNFLVEDGYAYCVVAKESVSKQISIAFLERVKADFKKRYGGGKADTAIAKSLNKEFGPVMKEHMKYIINHAEEIVKLIKVKAQVSEVKSIMLENIDKVLYCLGVRLFLFFYPGIQSFPSAVVTLHLGLMYSPLAFLCSSLLKSSMKARGGGI
ncbi:Vesicle-associated membrane protein 724 isoform B [Glycine soja]|uniref:Vesicle-associated membrane protein 724 isoform B n=1 Tax=Glycine soja TaxID=3848 RepID=A0A445IWQ0_GLYSO|nr:Vesicle-associated membrane protein 724 isoform B [Glycine soja]